VSNEGRFQIRPPVIVAAAAVVLVLLLLINFFRALPAAASQVTVGTLGGGSSPILPWPSNGQGAIGILGSGVLSQSPNVRQRPIASVAKVMTALVTVEAKPLAAGQSGPTITVTEQDVATYDKDKGSGQSVVVVQAGEQLTEYQALEALLIPSGNNIGDLLARWAFGSVSAGLQRMNTKARDLGLDQTTFADTNGFSPQTKSNPLDLVVLGEAAVQQDVIAEIVARRQVDLPLNPTSYNVNYNLGQHGIDGIKTGNIPEAGAVYLFSAPVKTDSGQTVTLVGAVMGLPTLDLAFAAANALIEAVGSRVGVHQLISRGQDVGRYQAPWGSSIDVVTDGELAAAYWPGAPIRARLAPSGIHPPAADESKVGDLVVAVGLDGHAKEYHIPVLARGNLTDPGPLWRLTRLS
jgi:serine-type D-Ala-D-Ala carboxypeptidase (penicillin-binding protein 5/6)